MSSSPPPSSFGDRFAEVYDRMPHGTRPVTEEQLDTLQRLARTGEAAEIGVGTGRIALPFAHRGVRVMGVDASESMLSVLRMKLSESDPVALELVCSDATTTPLPRKVTLIYFSLNTLFNFGPSVVQRRTLELCASSLEEDGRLVIETFQPIANNLPRTASWIGVTKMDDDELILQCLLSDASGQVLQFQDVTFAGTGVALYPYRIYYHTATQLDEMADAANLVLEARWGSWSGDAMTESSSDMISVYRLKTP